MHTIRLKKNEERRILAGHNWIFSNEVYSPLRNLEPGQIVRVVSFNGRFLGVGPVNPHTLICIRLLTRHDEIIKADFYRQRLVQADEHRKRLYPGSTTYRLAFSDADFLPGLIVDRYDRHLAAQILTQGMARVQDLLVEILLNTFQPASITLCNDAPVRTLEQLALERRLVWGSLPEALDVELDGFRIHVSPLDGQKTGLYLDQRENRQQLKGLAQHARVLDAFCYEGAWGLYAARSGASEVLGIDQSIRAVERAQLNAQVNKHADVCRFEQQEVFDYLKKGDDQFDLIVLDPPAFAKSKTKLKVAERGYLELNRLAIQRIRPGGTLVTCSCSYHLNQDRFRGLVNQAARLAGRRLRLLEIRGQARDHPVVLSMPETAYLKCLYLQVLQVE